jgi:hypothetical protein
MNGWEILVLILTAVIVAILVWTVFGASGYIRGRKLARLADRRSVGDDDFYDRYYRSSGLTKDLVVKLRHELGAALDLSPMVLLPTDRFETELAVVKGWWYLDDSPDELVLLNRERERRLGVQIPIENIRTVDDYIRTIGSLEAGREALHRL